MATNLRSLAFLSATAIGFALLPGAASAQVQIQVVVPMLQFSAPPPLVLVTPGMWIVPDHDSEVFYVSGWYWTRSDGRWFRNRNLRGGWMDVRPSYVPRQLRRVPPGHYVHYQPGPKAKWRNHPGNHKGKAQPHTAVKHDARGGWGKKGQASAPSHGYAQPRQNGGKNPAQRSGQGHGKGQGKGRGHGK